MPRHVEDIVTKERKSIRDIPVPIRRKSVPTRVKEDDAPPPLPRQRKSRKSGRRWWFVVAAIVIALTFFVLNLFSGSTLSYMPKSAALSFAGDVYAATKTNAGESGLLYSVVKLSLDKGVVVPAGAEEEVSRKASGSVVIYNNNATAQELVATTRFETPDGKIYRLDKPVTVPARKTVGGETEPGSIDALVTADVAGDSHNIGLADFTLPGLRGTPRYLTVYARSKTPMSGGFVGKAKVVSPDKLLEAKTELEKALKRELIDQSKAQVPEEFILFPSLSIFVFEDLPQTDAGNGNVTVNLRGNVQLVMFKRSDLSSYLARSKEAAQAGESVLIDSLDNLSLEFFGAPPTDLLSSSQISFAANGTALVVWQIDEESLKTNLAGRSKKDVQSVVNNYPSITRADVVIRPFWRTSFSTDPKEITIKKLTAK